jgi:hypothetical protein
MPRILATLMAAVAILALSQRRTSGPSARDPGEQVPASNTLGVEKAAGIETSLREVDRPADRSKAAGLGTRVSVPEKIPSESNPLPTNSRPPMRYGNPNRSADNVNWSAIPIIGIESPSLGRGRSRSALSIALNGAFRSVTQDCGSRLVIPASIADAQGWAVLKMDFIVRLIVNQGRATVVGGEVVSSSFSDPDFERCLIETGGKSVEFDISTLARPEGGLASVEPAADGSYRLKWPLSLFRKVK